MPRKSSEIEQECALGVPETARPKDFPLSDCHLQRLNQADLVFLIPKLKILSSTGALIVT